MGLLDTILGGQNKNEEPVVEKAAAKVKDPVCGMELDPKTAAASLEQDGQRYYFCSEDCKNKFSASQAEEIKTENRQKQGGCC